MNLYFSALACSLASRIALYEAGASATFIEVDAASKRTETGQDYRAIHALGLVPALQLGDADVLSENPAILQFLAQLYPAARLAPEGARATARLQQWLGFIGTELHKPIYAPLLDKTAPEAVKAYALAKVESRLRYLNAQLVDRQFLLDHFTVADAYLFAVLNWSAVTPVDLKPYPAIVAYHEHLLQRPSVARAFAEELALYQAELARHAAA
jgi:glutathione S-transferase